MAYVSNFEQRSIKKGRLEKAGPCYRICFGLPLHYQLVVDSLIPNLICFSNDNAGLLSVGLVYEIDIAIALLDLSSYRLSDPYSPEVLRFPTTRSVNIYQICDQLGSYTHFPAKNNIELVTVSASLNTFYFIVTAI
jgi:hypothetical protein